MYRNHTPTFIEALKTEGIFLCHTVEAHSCLLKVNMTFDLAEIEEMMPQQARKQLEIAGDKLL